MASLLKRLSGVLNRYLGAEQSTRRGFVYSGYQHAWEDISKCTRVQLQQKARFLEQNHYLVQRWCDLIEQYSCPLTVEPASSSTAFNDIAREQFNTWAIFPDLQSNQSFAQMQALIARTVFGVDGEAFVVQTVGAGNWPRLRLLEAHSVETPRDMTAKEGKTVVDGVQIDSRRRPVGYFEKFHTEDGEKYRVLPATAVHHIFEPSRIGQYRGIPGMHSVMNLLQDLMEIQELEMTATKDAATRSNILKTETGEMDASQTRAARFSLTGTNSAGKTISENRVQYYQDALPGRTVVVKTNESLEQSKSERPSQNVQTYWQKMKEDACTGYGIPYVICYPDSMQGTVYRGALDMADRYFKARADVIRAFTQRIYRWVIDWHMRIPGGPFDGIEIPSDWWAAEFHAPRSIVVDLGYKTDEIISKIEAGLLTPQEYFGEMSKPWRNQLRKKCEFLKYREQLAAEFDLEEGAISNLGEAASNEADHTEAVQPAQEQPLPQDPVTA